MQDLTDYELLCGIVEGNSDSLACVYDRYSAEIYATLIKIFEQPALAKKVLEETFYQAWLSAPDIYQRCGASVSLRNCLIELIRQATAAVLSKTQLEISHLNKLFAPQPTQA